VSKIINILDSSGCTVQVECAPCKNPHSRAVYRVDQKQHPIIQLCSNKVEKYYDVIESITHELIHVHDHCVNKYDLNDEKQVACTEIRASMHAECRDFQFNLSAMESCVRQHATLSLLQNDGIDTQEEAEFLVESMMNKCLIREFYYCFKKSKTF
jgi:inner membrane protease ATP23